MLLAGGRLADLFGRRRMLAAGLVLFAAAARTAHAGGSLAAGYRLSFLMGTGIAVLAAALVTAQLRTR